MKIQGNLLAQMSGYSRFYDQWLKVEETPSENLDCSNCRMVKSGDYRPDLKCCTYFPFLPNFTVGFLLEQDRPDSRAALEKGRLTPLGLFPGSVHLDLKNRLGPSAFGRSRDLRCPFFAAESGGCTIWQVRPSVCASFFCHSATQPEAAPGKSAHWQRVERRGNIFEWTLAHEVLWRKGFTQTEIAMMKLENSSEQNLWFEWAANPHQLLIDLYHLAREVTPAEIRHLIADGAEESRLT